MNRRVYAAIIPVLGLTVWAMAQTPGDPLIEGLRNVEVASVADAIEQLYGQKAYMSHDMRPLAKTKFAGPAVTVLLKKEEHAEGSKASQGMPFPLSLPARAALRFSRRLFTNSASFS